MAEITPEFGKYYIVEVAYNENNPIHRALMFSYRTHKGGASADLSCAGYEGVLNRNIEDLAYFRVIAPIEGMNSPFRNRYKLPRALRSSKYRKVKL